MSNIKLKSNIILKSKYKKEEDFLALVPYKSLPRYLKDTRNIHKLTFHQQIQQERYLYKATIFQDIYDDQ